MSIKINQITRNSETMAQSQLQSIKIEKVNSLKQEVVTSAMSDMENVPGPDKHTNNNINNGHHDEFHFLKNIIIDNELY